jgi:phosphonate transport system ATP-binding protein
MITLEHISKIFAGETMALRDVSLSVKRGEVVTLLGPSGAGKSTLLRCVNGFVTPSAGHVVVNNVRIEPRPRVLRAVRRRAGMIFQQFNLVGRLTVLENVLAGRLAHRPTLPTLARRFPQEDYELAERALARVDLADRAAQRADTLSGGERQRVAIARVLAQEPSILLADEPVASLDPKTSVAVLELIRAIAAEHVLTVLMSLHQIEWARRFCDRIVGLAAGAVVFEGSPDALTGPVIDRIYGSQLHDLVDA